MRIRTFAVPTAFLSLAVLGAALAGGCESAPSAAEHAAAERPAAANPLFGEWALDRIGGQNVAPMLLSGAKPPTLAFSPDGKVSGFTGVNRLSSSTDPAGLAAGRISLTTTAVTRMAGLPAAMKLESLFLKNLGKATEYRFDDNGRLELTDGSEALMRFVVAAK